MIKDKTKTYNQFILVIFILGLIFSFFTYLGLALINFSVELNFIFLTGMVMGLCYLGFFVGKLIAGEEKNKLFRIVLIFLASIIFSIGYSRSYSQWYELGIFYTVIDNCNSIKVNKNGENITYISKSKLDLLKGNLSKVEIVVPSHWDLVDYSVSIAVGNKKYQYDMKFVEQYPNSVIFMNKKRINHWSDFFLSSSFNFKIPLNNVRSTEILKKK